MKELRKYLKDKGIMFDIKVNRDGYMSITNPVYGLVGYIEGTYNKNLFLSMVYNHTKMDMGKRYATKLSSLKPMSETEFYAKMQQLV